MRFFIFSFLVYFVLMSSAALADSRLSAANNMLLKQLKLINLVEPAPAYKKYMTQLASAIVTEEQFELIEADIVDFWSRHQIKTHSTEASKLNDLLVRAMSLEPKINDYLQLQNRLSHLQWLTEQTEWQRIRVEGLIRPGMQSVSLPAIAKRLSLLGDGTANAVELNVFEDDLVNTVKRFQRRHGLTPDGIIGPDTMKWLNMAPSQRAIILARSFIQKSTFMSQRDDRFLVINIPAFEMELINDGRVELESRVIVGKPYRQTPLLSSAISNVVINPSWRVPKKILYNDLLPQVRKDGSYIEQREFDVFDRQGNRVIKSAEQWRDLAFGPFPFRFVQRPGVNNTLGRYKFYFPNDFSVYLHDTADPNLFNQSYRALSSGCIRIENVEGLANWMAANLVKDKQTWVDRHVNRDKTQWFALNSTLNVHLVYWTAWIDKDNLAQFRNDIYQKQSISDGKPPSIAQINSL
ncbi:murein L,D-transpeptidase [Shewanella sp. 10N.286.45.A1]|uniref:L,D-transpeptidase family protein n=1 Tax=Shewanella sp. 10N.286.45.A1 TaxID=3229694 RepID=UPI00355209F6